MQNTILPLALLIMRRVDTLLGSNHKIDDCTEAITTKRPTKKNNTGMAFSAWSAKQQLNINRGMVFSVQCIRRCYKQDN
jgi:hypothetical protein